VRCQLHRYRALLRPSRRSRAAVPPDAVGCALRDSRRVRGDRGGRLHLDRGKAAARQRDRTVAAGRGGFSFRRLHREPAIFRHRHLRGSALYGAGLLPGDGRRRDRAFPLCRPPEPQDLARRGADGGRGLLRSRGRPLCRRGLGDFWTAHSVNALAHDKVTVETIWFPGGKPMRFDWVSSEADIVTEPQFVAFSAANSFGVSVESVRAGYGPIASVEHPAGFTVVILARSPWRGAC